MRPSDDPLPDLTPEDRLRGVAAVLAVGLRRLRDARLAPPLCPSEKERESVADGLELPAETRLSVHTG
jgi:hypothetical protein